MLNIVLFGPPGSGKGTQASLLEKEFNLVHISTGDMFRYEIGHKTELGLLAKSYTDKGALVPDQVTISMLKNKIQTHPKANGFIFDGFPRTIPQAEALDHMLSESNASIKLMLSLIVEEKELLSRLQKRALDSNRKDDQNIDVIKNRIRIYKKETFPVSTYYDKQGKLAEIKGQGSIDSIFNTLSAEIHKIS